MSAVLKNSIVLIMQPHFIRSIAVSSLCLSIVACSNDFSAGSSLKNLLMHFLKHHQVLQQQELLY